MTADSQPTASFAGFPEFAANVTFVPIQFFTVVLPRASRGCVRIVGYALRKLLGWVDEHGNPTREQVRFTYRELTERAGVGRDAIADALREALDRRCLRCLQPPLPDAAGQPAQSGLYELCWDPTGPYTDNPAEFRGFYYPEAVVMEEPAGTGKMPRPKAARKNIPNAFFDILLPRERLSVVRVVGALLFYSIQWGPGGERRVPVSRSITDLSRLTNLSRQHVHEAVREAGQRGYLRQTDAGCFDPAAGQQSRPATYAIRWANAPAQTAFESSPGLPPVGKGERAAAGRSETVDGAPVGKGARERSEKVNGDRSEKVNGIRIKTELKTDPITAAAAAPKPERTEGGTAAAAAAESLQLLLQTGFDEATARHLAHKRSGEVIARQIAWLPLRHSTRSRLGLLRRAIEQDWPKPEATDRNEDDANAHLGLARQFASHYYAAYHGFDGTAATEPFAKDLDLAAKFIPRLLAQESNESRVPEWGRQFGSLMRVRHQSDPKAKPNLSFALVLFGDQFLRTLQGESTARQKEALSKAQAARQAAFWPAYLAYLEQTEKTLRQTAPALYAAFVEDRRALRHRMTSGPFLASAARLARFDSDESRWHAFAEFFRQHPQQPVPDFWQWDKSRNSLGKSSASINPASMFVPQPCSTATEGGEGTPASRSGGP